MLARLVALATLIAAAAPVDATGKQASAQMIACHKEATQRYIASFEQVGAPRHHFGNDPVLVTAFESDTQKYEAYMAECLKRPDGAKE